MILATSAMRCTSRASANTSAHLLRSASRTPARTTPSTSAMLMLVCTASRARPGLPAPSSLLTRTLQTDANRCSRSFLKCREWLRRDRWTGPCLASSLRDEIFEVGGALPRQILVNDPWVHDGSEVHGPKTGSSLRYERCLTLFWQRSTKEAASSMAETVAYPQRGGCAEKAQRASTRERNPSKEQAPTTGKSKER